ncbi:hypothetical protein BAQ46_15960 [Bacillus paranthracis]|uniref:hypothetical protein n=1 Tax=Bacillus paranthracis TaxID=2026186 RepID=UPI0008FDC009|nr:hypothetical protein [Bacillus paranthracis]OJE23487.1 hypothetical protein BAQ46_15960 [Bacillus paranthracis]
MMFTITKKFILAKVEEKQKCNMYTLLDTENHNKSVLFGAKTEEIFEELKVVEIDMNVRIQNEKFTLYNSEKVYKDTATMFVTDIRKVK